MFMCIYLLYILVLHIICFLYSIYRAHKPIIPQVYFVDCFNDCVDPYINWYLYNSE